MPVKKGGPRPVALLEFAAIAFVLLFLLSFFGHAWGGAREYSEERSLTARRRWGVSEFLSIAATVLFTIWAPAARVAGFQARALAARQDGFGMTL